MPPLLLHFLSNYILLYCLLFKDIFREPLRILKKNCDDLAIESQARELWVPGAEHAVVVEERGRASPGGHRPSFAHDLVPSTVAAGAELTVRRAPRCR